MPPVAPLPTDLDKIQGAWKVVSWELGGEPAPPNGARLVFTDQTGRLEAPDGAYLMTFELDPSRDPKTMDLVLMWMGSAPAKGIYELKGDELRICYSWGWLPRPTAFTTRPGAREMLYVLRRE